MNMIRTSAGARLVPQMPPGAFQTYSIVQPLATHWRRATCVEIDCPNYLNGWRVRVEHLDDATAHMARSCGLRYSEMQVAAGETWLVYEPGQICFGAAQHRMLVGRPELYLVRGGDWRANTDGPGTPQPWRAEDWLDSFATNQDRYATAIERG